MAFAPAALLELVMHPKVQEAAGRAFETVYARIFNDTKLITVSANARPKPFTERELLEKILAAQPTNEDMALAFASLQSELRRGQQRLWLGIVCIGLINLGFMAFLTLTRR